MEYNKDELEAPSWIDNLFFEKVLKNCDNIDDVSISDYKITPGSGKGEHYASIMFRASVTYDTSTKKGNRKSLIIKTMPELDGHKKDMLGKSTVFETEIDMYTKIIPKFEEELKKIGDDTVLAPKALYCSLEPKKYIVFEDITELGYDTIPNREISMEELKAALLKLAKWHAVSHKLISEGDILLPEDQESFLNYKNDLPPFMKSGMNDLVETISTLDEFKKYVPKLRSIQNDVLKRCIESSLSFKTKSSPSIFVLLHGDFHIKNMMFKRNKSSELEDVKLIDFQVCYVGPAVLDIFYAMYLLVSQNMRTNHYEEIVYYYASNFVETLQKMDFKGDVPKVSDFFIDILRHRHYELFLMTSFLPLCVAFYAMKEFDLEENLFTDARKKLYTIPEYLKEVKRLLEKMLYRGYLE